MAYNPDGGEFMGRLLDPWRGVCLQQHFEAALVKLSPFPGYDCDEFMETT